MRARLGWVVAALLLALALTSGPDALDTSPPASAAQSAAASEIREKRDLRPRDDDVEIRHQVAERGAPGHLLLAALPPSPQTASPVPVRGTAQAPPDSAPATVVDLSGHPRLGTRTPEALQIFRC